MLDSRCRKYIQPIIKKGADFFIKLGFSANQVTVIALVLGILSGIFTYYERPILALISLWLSGYLDAVDGTIAREKGSTLFGTVMDITFDRIVEIGIILGICYRYPEQSISLLLLTSSIIISMTIFLTTGNMVDKITEKSFYYQAGLAERTEGFIMFSIMILFTQYLTIIILIFVVMILFTAWQRFIEAKKMLDNQNKRRVNN